jgi:hypothetical protein
MPNGLNLRGDLPELSDTELAERLEAAWRTVDAAEQPNGLLERVHHRLNRLSPFYSVRGPVKHPRAYRFYGLFAGLGEAGPIGLLAAWLLSSKRITGAMMDASPDKALCEIRDINDEIERRMRARRTAGA